MKRFILAYLICLTLLAIPAFAQATINILSTSPINGTTDVAIDLSDILITFDTNILDSGSFTGGNKTRVTVDNKASYTVSLEDGVTNDSIKIHLTAPLSYSTTYTVTISKWVRDLTPVWPPNNLGTTYQFSFTTMAKPSTDTTRPVVVSTFPLNNSTGVATNVTPSVTFSEIMASATINTSTITLTNIDDANSSVNGSVSLDSTGKIAYFDPTVTNLSSNTNYKLTVSTGVTDLGNNHLLTEYYFVFKTAVVDNTRPTILAVTPANGATGVLPVDPILSTNTVVTVKFSEAMDDTTITAAGAFTVAGVTGIVTYDPTTWTATFTPDPDALAYGTTYTATVSKDVADLAGNKMSTSTNKVWTFTTVAAASVPPMNDYCNVPSFLSNSKDNPPNVLLLIDNSGSMNEFAYKKDPDSGCSYGANCYDDSYDPTVDYYGYFDSGKMYNYNSSGGYFEVDTSPTRVVDPNSFYNGSFLNWLTMRRIDIVRKVLTGGNGTPLGDPNTLIPATDPDRDHYKKYNNVKYSVEAGTSTEVINDLTNNVKYKLQIKISNFPQDFLLSNHKFGKLLRFGTMYFNEGYSFEEKKNNVRDGGYIADIIGTGGEDIINRVNHTDPSTWTPLAESLYEAVRYYEVGTKGYENGNYSQDPIQQPCQKNFVLILTDGESTKDQNLPGTYFKLNTGTEVTDDYGFNIKTWMDKIATNENNNYPLSTWKVSRWNQLPGTAGSAGSWYLPGVAYYAHTTDLRNDTPKVSESPLDGKQNLTIYTVYAFDDSLIGEDLLRMTAKYGGFVDSDNSGDPDNDSKWDKDGDGNPDTFFKARSGQELQKALTRAFNDILARVSSGTAASILSNSEGSGANILQAMFYPKKYIGDDSADWIGELHNLWYYVDPQIQNSTVREDTDYSGTPPHELNLSSDYVVNFFYDSEQQRTMVQRYEDALGDGKPDLDTNSDTIKDSYTLIGSPIDPDNVKSLWRAGQRLFYRTQASRTIYTNLNGSSAMSDFQSLIGNASIIPYLMAANQTEANKIINYISGTDQEGFRSRTVTIGSDKRVWKLGDIISSTPRLQSSIQLNNFNLAPTSGYKDKSYGAFIAKQEYRDRGMVYVGANDGMLHAFKLGNLDVTPSMSIKGILNGSSLGEEQWAFIPRNALPYLRYLGDTTYEGFNHLYFVDGSISISDASIGKPSTGCDASTNYYDCNKDNTGGSNWRSVLIGSMGMGGASKIKGAGCKSATSSIGTCVETPTLDPTDNTKGLGYSSYFALDISDQTYDSGGNLVGPPKLLWEFSHPDLGFSTSGAALVRIAAKTSGQPDRNKNGHWYAVVASGPTGAIDVDKQKFMGTSNQPLSIFVIDLATGTLLRKINTLNDSSQLTNAFAGAITAAPIDTDKWSVIAGGNYQDDALYIGYTQDTTHGGILRLITKEDPDPSNWVLSKVIDGVGSVTANISRLQDRKNHNLWLYFGTGRYFYPKDDLYSQRIIAGIKEPCYTASDKLDPACTTTIASPYTSSLVDQSDANKTMTDSDKGWFINLSPEAVSSLKLGAERSVTDPVALTNGALFFTTFQPTSDVCGFGGNSYLWGVKYNSGLELPQAAKEAKALVQVSTGSFEQIDLSNALTDRNLRRTGKAMVGKPPMDPPPVVTKANLKPVKRILHIQEQ